MRFALVLLAAAAVLFYRLDEAPVTIRSEARVSDVAQEMVASGDWVVPRRNGAPWLNKPPLYYWSAAATTAVRGAFDGWSLRLPAALSALLLLGLAARWGLALGRPGLAALAPFLWVLCFEVTSHGRRGVAEMTMALLVGACWFTFWRLYDTRNARLLPAFATFFALAILAKATVPVMLVLLPIAVFLLSRGELRRAFRPRPVAWTLLALLVGFSWYGVVAAVVPGSLDHFFKAATLPVGVKSDVGAGHYEPVWNHVPYLISAGTPTVLLLPLALVAAWRTRLWRDDPARRFVALTFVVGFVAFSLLPQKRKAYNLPLLLPLALLTGDAVLATITRAGVGERRLRRALAFGGGFVGLFVAVVGGAYLGVVLGSSALAWTGVVGLGAVGGVLAARWAARGRWLPFCVAFGVLWSTLLLLDHASLDVWRRQFEAGTVACRADYDAARWSALLDEHPRLARMFRPSDGLVRKFFPGSAPGVEHPRCGQPATIPPFEPGSSGEASD